MIVNSSIRRCSRQKHHVSVNTAGDLLSLCQDVGDNNNDPDTILHISPKKIKHKTHKHTHAHTHTHTRGEQMRNNNPPTCGAVGGRESMEAADVFLLYLLKTSVIQFICRRERVWNPATSSACSPLKQHNSHPATLLYSAWASFSRSARVFFLLVAAREFLDFFFFFALLPRMNQT